MVLGDRKSTRLNSSHLVISYAVFCFLHARHPPSFPTRRSSDLVGTRLPAHATSMGRVLLAALQDDRLDAYLDAVTLAPLTERTIVDRDRLRAEVERTRTRGWCLEIGRAHV